MTKKKTVSLLFWIGFIIYFAGLFLPYEVITSHNSVVLGYNNREFKSGIELKVPFFSLIPIILMLVFIYVKHTNFSRWFSLIWSILLIFPLLPFYFFVANFCIFCDSEPGIGLYLHIPSCILFLSAMIVNFRIPVQRSQNELNKHELLDDF